MCPPQLFYYLFLPIGMNVGSPFFFVCVRPVCERARVHACRFSVSSPREAGCHRARGGCGDYRREHGGEPGPGALLLIGVASDINQRATRLITAPTRHVRGMHRVPAHASISPPAAATMFHLPTPAPCAPRLLAGTLALPRFHHRSLSVSPRYRFQFPFVFFSLCIFLFPCFF